MNRPLLGSGLALALSAAVSVVAQRPAADLILSNGKIATVDEAFRFAQAVAVRGDRIVTVGSNQDVEPWAGPATRRIDLAGRTVVPGLIHNHLHLLRAGPNWPREVRWDGVDRRSAALDLLRAKAPRAQ